MHVLHYLSSSSVLPAVMSASIASTKHVVVLLVLLISDARMLTAHLVTDH
jgi:hypothetical protein